MVASLDQGHRECCFDTTPENAFQLKCRGFTSVSFKCMFSTWENGRTKIHFK